MADPSSIGMAAFQKHNGNGLKQLTMTILLNKT